jgi:hypothetical protein
VAKLLGLRKSRLLHNDAGNIRRGISGRRKNSGDAVLRAKAKITGLNAGSGGSDQCSIPNAQFSSERRSDSVEFCENVDLRMGIEHWELSIGQIPEFFLRPEIPPPVPFQK